MHKKFLSLLLIIPLLSFEQDYRVSLIPDSLKENANVVKRIDQTKIVIKDIGKAYINHKWAYTIFNEAGESAAFYTNHYDAFHSLSDITGKMYDSTGKLLKSIKKRDIVDLSDNDGISLVSDSRIKIFAFFNKVYPYTVEFEDEIEENGIYNINNVWVPIDRDNLSVQQSNLEIETPADYNLRYKQFCYPAQPNIVNNKDKIIYTWQIANKKAIREEVYQPPFKEITPFVFLAPTNFKYAGYTGNMNTWNDLGKLQTQLNLNRQNLPDNIKQEVHKLTDGLTPEEKVNILYKYLQDNTRYISVQLGIGGLQPFDASYVAKNKYGDCKALSNYMVSLLKEAGVKANYVLIKGDEDDKGAFADFPMDLFNHIICCVPLKKDTIWLECTSQTVSAGYMGTFTGDRYGLLIDDDGGHLVHTPAYGLNDNMKSRKIDAMIDENGNLTAEMNTHYTGISQEAIHSLFHSANKDEQEKYLNNDINLPTYTVEKINFKETKNRIPAMDEYLKIVSSNYATITGKRLFVRPDVINVERKLPSDRPRLFDVEIPYSYKEIDSINISLPPKYKVEALPKNVEMENKFGKYSVTYNVTDSKINMVRIQNHYAVHAPASEYDDLVKFYDAMYKADHAKIVFVKQD